MTPRYAVFGHPVAHSLSPRIHQAFARAAGIDIDYARIDVDPDGFSTALAEFARQGGVGANITLPYKEAAFALAHESSARAHRAGAVNTLTRRGEHWLGDNTDGAGLVRDLTERHRLDLRGRRVLMLGAGGAAHGVAPALLDAGIDALLVVNRNAARADRLVDALAEPARVSSRYWEDLGAIGDFELVVNATSAGRGDGGRMALPFSLAKPRFDAVDLSYGEAAIGFLAWARAAGAERAIDGLGMLVEQAAESFEAWHGRRPDTEPVYRELRAGSAVLRTAD
jgi:shikimate dehydrogenase